MKKFLLSAITAMMLPLAAFAATNTVMDEEINVERYPGMGYTPTTATVDFTAAKTALGIDNVSAVTLVIINPDGSEVTNYGTYDGWFSTQGYAKTWSGLNAEAKAADKAGICVKFFQAIDGGSFDICDMNGADEVGKTYTVCWALKANDKAYNYAINVTFVEASAVTDLTKSDLAIATSVEYTTDEGSYVTKWAKLSDGQVSAICTELGISSLSDATVYGYNPTTGELVSNYAGFDGWRNADGDFQNWTGNAEVPFCIKYNDGKNYECYNIGGLEPHTYKGYWAIANNTKYVLVEIDFIYSAPPAVVLTLTGTEVEGTVTYDVNVADYTAKSFILSDEQANSILTAIGLTSFEDEKCVAYIYDPATGEFANESYDGWRDADGLGKNWTGTAEVPICVKFQYSNDIVCFNLYGIEPQTITTYYAIANDETKKAALIKVNFVYEGSFPTYTVAGAYKVGEEETVAFFGTIWDSTLNANDMQHSATDRNIWTLTFEDVELTAGTILYKVVKDHSWNNNWGFDGNNADYIVNMPDGLEKAVFDITFTFSPIGLSNGYNVNCDVVYDKQITVGINTVKANTDSEVIYNLQGIRLHQLQKGLNIVNGKIVVIK